MSLPRPRLVICDLDNTLYDWVAYFVPAFYAMVDVACQLKGWDRELLLDDFRRVHQRHKDSEHPFALMETDHVQSSFRGVARNEIANYFDPAFHAFNSVRKKTLKLYPGVLEMLSELTSRNVILVAHTDSKLFAVLDRLRRLGIADFFAEIFCGSRSAGSHPKFPDAEFILPPDMAGRVHELSHHQRKPDPDVLAEICRKVGVEPHEAIYIGDSIARDVLMAKRAGVYAVWAKYGSTHDATTYEQLVRISHWTAADVEREKKLLAEALLVRPDFVAEKSCDEILELMT